MNFDDALELLTNPASQTILNGALSLLPPPYGIAVGAVLKAVPMATNAIENLIRDEPVDVETLRVQWASVKAEAARVGADWDASEAEKKD